MFEICFCFFFLFACLAVNMSSNGKHIVFVYGTLKTGYRNHDVILNPRNGSAKFLDAAETLFQYPLIVNSEFHVPLLLRFEGEGEVSHEYYL